MISNNYDRRQHIRFFSTSKVDQEPQAHLSEDQVKGLEYALSQMRKKETEMVLLRYRDEKTFQVIAEIYSRSDSRIS